MLRDGVQVSKDCSIDGVDPTSCETTCTAICAADNATSIFVFTTCPQHDGHLQPRVAVRLRLGTVHGPAGGQLASTLALEPRLQLAVPSIPSGTPDAIAARMLGHSTTAVLKRYQHVLEESTRAAADRMDQVLGGGIER